VPAFFIGTVPVTQALWTHVAGTNSNPALNRGMALPVENVSWDAITQGGGFLDLINESGLRKEVLAQLPAGRGVFRLPSETEWEYAARGGSHWRDGFRFSGSNDIDAVAWYDRRHGDHTQPVAQKAPNQLGLYDVSGNVWEWCQDLFTSNVAAIPRDGTPLVGPGDERVLRGAVFTIGRSTARCPSAIRLSGSITMGASAFALCSRSPIRKPTLENRKSALLEVVSSFPPASRESSSLTEDARCPVS
jgi:formylglycine-generating enzyme required for sulfatase activity